VFSGVLLHNTILLIISPGNGFLLLFLGKAVTGAVYTSAIAWVFFLIKEGKITFGKLKAIF
jgi:hypothetical protein